MSQRIAAIVGRPNVGKSSLFNRLIGRKIAIVDDMPGVTRDRNYGEAEWNGKKFFLIDTGGYVPESKDKFEAAIREQVKISIDEADIILFVVDAKSGISPLDLEIARLLRKEANRESNENKKVILVLNKVDNESDEASKHDFFRLSLGEPAEVSALIGRRSGDLLDRITESITEDQVEEDTSSMKFAIIGRPNVGKSSLANALTQSNRNIVTDIAGTTRDPIDSIIKYYGKDITIIDTAGLRKKSRIKRAENLEYYSALRTHKSIERCDVAIIVIDATTIVSKLSKFADPSMAIFKLSKEDVEIITKAAELKKGILIIINKWDLIEKDTKTAKLFEEKVKDHLKTFDYLPFMFTSAITKQRVSKIIEIGIKIFEERAKEIKTSELNAGLSPFIKENPPRSKSHKEIKLNYITQLQHSPPVIGFFSNLPDEVEVNYKRYLEHKIREVFGFVGVPLTLAFKHKNKPSGE